jgi:DNA-binding response OmpR family regulator
MVQLRIEKGKVLVLASRIEDADSIYVVLKEAGYDVSVVQSATVTDISVGDVHAAIVVAQPYDKAEHICGTITRKAATLPLVVLGCDDIEAKVSLLNLGADDYIVEPFDAGEFLARISSRIRRATLHLS